MSPLLSELEILEIRLSELDEYDFATSSDLRAWQITRFALQLELLKIRIKLDPSWQTNVTLGKRA